MIFHSAFEYVYLWLPLIGFIVGFLGSLTGGGGGFIFIPLLTILFKVPPQIAIASSLAATLPHLHLPGIRSLQKEEPGLSHRTDLCRGRDFRGTAWGQYRQCDDSPSAASQFWDLFHPDRYQYVFGPAQGQQSDCKRRQSAEFSKAGKYSRSTVYGFSRV